MIGPSIHGVPCQTIMKVAERTIVLGKLVDRTMCGHVYWMEVMGTSFWYWEERYHQTKTINLYGQPREERRPIIRRVLKGCTWQAQVDHDTVASPAGRSKWQSSVQGMKLVKNEPQPGELRWGQTYFEFVARAFEGDEGDFKRDMLYATMVGMDDTDWQGVYETDKD